MKIDARVLYESERIACACALCSSAQALLLAAQ